MDYDYAHEASLAGWIVDNYQNFIQAHNKTQLELPDNQDFASCFGFSQYEHWSEFKELLLKCHLFTEHINGVFGVQCYSQLRHFSLTPQFQTLSRLAPYHKYLIGDKHRLSNPLLPLHHPGVRHMLAPRSLNAIELQLFNIYNYKDPSTPLTADKVPQRAAPLIRRKEEFKRAMNKRFKYNVWAKWIKWNKFFMVGGSVLNCLLNKEFAGNIDSIMTNTMDIGVNCRVVATSQDLDFFFTCSDFIKYRDSVDKFTEQLETVADGGVQEGKKDSAYVRTRIAKVKGQELKFQFIWYDDDMAPDVILHIFDLDACQVGWDGKDVLGTPSFVQSLTTSTMINYKLVNNEDDAETFLPRTYKYLQRGFTLLTPKKFDTSILAALDQVKQDDIDKLKRNIKCNYTGFLLNNDSMQVCRHFVELVTGVPQLREDPSSSEEQASERRDKNRGRNKLDEHSDESDDESDSK